MKWLALTLLIFTASEAAAAPVTPSFTTGTVTAYTESTTTVNETIKQIDYQVGDQYSVSGTNINIPGNPTPQTNYSITVQGAPFQFTESYFGPGLTRETFIERTTVIESATETMSVFSQ